MILGIDGGNSKAGICLIDNGVVLYHKTTNIMETLKLVIDLHTVYRFKRAVVEMPSNSLIYSKHGAGISPAIMRKIMCNVGENRQCAKMIAMKLESIGVQVLLKKPARGTTKWDAKYWCSVFNYTKRPPSEHARDAGVIALTHEKWIGWKD